MVLFGCQCCSLYTCREEDSSSYETVTDSESDAAPDKQDEAKARYGVISCISLTVVLCVDQTVN